MCVDRIYVNTALNRPERIELLDRDSNAKMFQIDVQWQEGSSTNVGPLGWKTSEYSDAGALIGEDTVRVKSWRVGEPSESDFVMMELPRGTWANDDVNTPSSRIFLGNGNWRTVAPGEFDGTNYEELLNSDPPGTRKRWWLWPIVGIAVVAIAFWVQRRRRARASTT